MENKLKRGKTGIVFTSDEYDASMAEASADAKDEDLLGNGEGDSDEVEVENLNRVESQAAARAAQVGLPKISPHVFLLAPSFWRTAISHKREKYMNGTPYLLRQTFNPLYIGCPLLLLPCPMHTQAKKDEDVKRLQKLFNDSPSDDSDSPEEDLGDDRELLP